ncbi:hypothetical protein JZ751_020740, partial [Albula glossodonta]
MQQDIQCQTVGIEILLVWDYVRVCDSMNSLMNTRFSTTHPPSPTPPQTPYLFSMDLRLALTPLLWTLLVFLSSAVSPSAGQKVYTNTWAVHITGGAEEANRIASKHGFINHGH